MYSLMSKRRNSTPSDCGELLGELGLADAGRAGEEERADRLVGVAEAGARELDGADDLLDRVVLAEDHAAQIVLEALQAVLLA